MSSPARQIEQIRKLRVRRERDTSIADVISRTADHASRTQKKLGELIALWEELVPAELAAHTSLTGYRAGVLHVIVDSSPIAFDLDRLLRGGLTEELRRRFRGTMTRVKTRTGTLDQSG
jgi:hypothetical protein